MAIIEHLVKSFRLPNGTKCAVEGSHLHIGRTILTVQDIAQVVRIYFTEIPLQVDDARIKLIDEIREALVKEEPGTGRRWIVLDALRNVSLLKWRKRRQVA